MRKVVWSFYGLLILAMLQPAIAAKRLGPPIEQLKSEPERIRIVIATAGKKTEAGKIMFFVSERLSGEAPDEVLLRIDEATFSDVVVDRSYVVAWTYLRRNRGVIGGWEEDPDGPSTVNLLGMGSTALFEDTADIRLLFTPAASGEAPSAGQQLKALLAQLQRPDFRSRGLVISELYLRPDLTELIDRSHAETIKGVLQTGALDPQHRDFLLRSTLRVSKDLTSPWLAEELRRDIIAHGTQYDLSSFVPALVRTAARGLQQVGERADVELLSVLLYANNPGVSEAALAAMAHLDPAATAGKAKQAIARGWLHDETRRVLEAYLRRIESDA